MNMPGKGARLLGRMALVAVSIVLLSCCFMLSFSLAEDAAIHYSEPVSIALFADVGTAQARFVALTVQAPLDDAPFVMDRGISGFFSLEVRADGSCYLPGAAQLPYITELARDCIAPPYQLSIPCNTQDFSQWGWRTDEAYEDYDLPGLAFYQQTKPIDPATGKLIGLQMQPEDNTTVYLVHNTTIYRYQVAYYNDAGNPYPHRELYALGGSDLTKEPAIDLSIPENERIEFVVLGTGVPAPSAANAPEKVQARVVQRVQHKVAFYVGNEPYMQAQTIETGGFIDWQAIKEPAHPDGLLFTGWVCKDLEDFNPLAPVMSDIILHAHFVEPCTLSFWIKETDASPYALRRIAPGAVPGETALVQPPTRNQRFIGWFDASGNLFDASLPVDRSLDLYARYEVLQAQGLMVTNEECIAAAFDSAGGYPLQMRLQCTVPVQYDEALDLYFITPDAIPTVGREDAFGNRHFLLHTPDAWGWAYAEADALSVFTQDSGRWYFGPGFRHDMIIDGRVFIQYLSPLTSYLIYFYDEGEILLPRQMEVLAGGSVSVVDAHKRIAALLPAQRLAAFSHWALLGQEGTVDEKITVTAPVSFIAAYKPTFTVSFYLDAGAQLPFYQQEVIAGESIQWAEVPQITRENSLFTAWHERETLTPFQQDAQIMGDTALVGTYLAIYTITAVGVEGEVLWVQTYAEGELADVDQWTVPQIPGGKFLYWVDAEGQVLMGSIPITRSMQVTGVYEMQYLNDDGKPEPGSFLESVMDFYPDVTWLDMDGGMGGVMEIASWDAVVITPYFGEIRVNTGHMTRGLGDCFD